MKIAFNTLAIEGEYRDRVLHLFYELEMLGCEMYVWSINEHLAASISNEYRLDATPIEKYGISKVMTNSEFPMDAAIEENPNDSLGAKLVIVANEIPEDTETYALALFKVLTAANNVTIPKIDYLAELDG